MEATLWCNYVEVRLKLNNNDLNNSHTCVKLHIIINYVLYKNIFVAVQKVTFLKWTQFMAFQKLRIPNLENQKIWGWSGWIYKIMLYSNNSISLWFAEKKVQISTHLFKQI